MKYLSNYGKMHYMFIVFGCRKFNNDGLTYTKEDFPKLTREQFLQLKKGWDLEYKKENK